MGGFSEYISAASKKEELVMHTEIDLEVVKSYMRHLVAETNQYPIVYKYIDFEAAVKMLSFGNIQFTRGDKLNDHDELSLSKCNITKQIKTLEDLGIPNSIIQAKFQEAQDFFHGIGICSCGKTPDNDVLWKNYASTNNIENGICIALDQSEVINHLHSNGYKIIALLVRYFDSVQSILPWDLYLGSQLERSFFLQYLYSSKQKDKWSDEDEIRFIYSTPFEGSHFRPTIAKSCFKAVYYGSEMSREERIKIGQILNKYPNIQRFT